MNKVKCIIWAFLLLPIVGVAQTTEIQGNNTKVIIVGNSDSISTDIVNSIDSLLRLNSAKKDYYLEEIASNRNSRLGIGFGGGIGTVKSSFAPQLRAGLQVWDLNFGSITGLGVIYSGYYFFDRNNNNELCMDINSFINLYVGFNNKWSLGVGILASREGEHFDKNTFKIFSSFLVLNRISISPELYITGGFKKAYPGFSITF